jgi:plastocyanin
MTQHLVLIEATGYRPAELQVEAGDTVVWTNVTTSSHSATEVNGGFDTGVIAPTQPSAPVPVNGTVSWRYGCSQHANEMTGRIDCP